MQKGAPVFVKVDEYKEVLEVLDMVKAKLAEVKQTISNMESLREEEDAEITAWNNAINSIEGKIENIDKMLYEPDQE